MQYNLVDGYQIVDLHPLELFYSESGAKWFLRNFGAHLSNYMAAIPEGRNQNVTVRTSNFICCNNLQHTVNMAHFKRSVRSAMNFAIRVSWSAINDLHFQLHALCVLQGKRLENACTLITGPEITFFFCFISFLAPTGAWGIHGTPRFTSGSLSRTVGSGR
jgi:hypothetical protein